MTDPNQPEVTQEDRQAVAAFFRDGRTSIAVKFRLGAEPEPLLEAFARHRAQARKQALEEAAKVALDLDWGGKVYDAIRAIGDKE